MDKNGIRQLETKFLRFFILSVKHKYDNNDFCSQAKSITKKLIKKKKKVFVFRN